LEAERGGPAPDLIPTGSASKSPALSGLMPVSLVRRSAGRKATPPPDNPTTEVDVRQRHSKVSTQYRAAPEKTPNSGSGKTTNEAIG